MRNWKNYRSTSWTAWIAITGLPTSFSAGDGCGQGDGRREIFHQAALDQEACLGRPGEKYDHQEKVREAIRQSIEVLLCQQLPGCSQNVRKIRSPRHQHDFRHYSRNVFPTMKVNWTTYPNDIGHRNWPGCFRCHDNHHVNQSGKVLTSTCSVCHTMPQRGPLLPLGATASTSSEPWHPWPLKGAHERILCSLCHRAGYRPPLGLHLLPQN